MNGVPRTVMLLLVFVVLVTLQYSVRPVLDWRASVDFVVIALLIVAVRVRPGAAALLGCATGLVVDAMFPLSFGAAALALTAVAFGASWLKSAFFSEHLGLNAVFFFAGKLAADLAFLLIERRLHGAALFQQLLVWSPLSAVVTAVAGVVLLLVLRPLVERPERRW